MYYSTTSAGGTSRIDCSLNGLLHNSIASCFRIYSSVIVGVLHFSVSVHTYNIFEIYVHRFTGFYAFNLISGYLSENVLLNGEAFTCYSEGITVFEYDCDFHDSSSISGTTNSAKGQASPSRIVSSSLLMFIPLPPLYSMGS